MGKYVFVNMSLQEIGYMFMGLILVDIDLQEGLLVKMCILIGIKSSTQNLDYSYVPFWCSRCHSLDHIVKGFPRSFHWNH